MSQADEARVVRGWRVHPAHSGGSQGPFPGVGVLLSPLPEQTLRRGPSTGHPARLHHPKPARSERSEGELGVQTEPATGSP